MKRIGIVLACLCIVAPALGVQEVTLKDLPPLERLRNCQYPDGHYAAQNGPCPPDTTEVGIAAVTKPDRTATFPPLPKPQATDAPAAKSPLHDFWITMAKWLGFALIVGLLAKVLKRSFFLWFTIGFILRAVLVAFNVIAF